MKLSVYNAVKRASVLVLCLSLLIRMLIPVGYMPTAVGDGWPVRLCQHGLPHGMLDGHGGHHATDGDEHDTLWDSCSFGVSSAVFVFGSEEHFQPAVFEHDQTVAVSATRATATRIASFQSRAPPRIGSFI